MTNLHINSRYCPPCINSIFGYKSWPYTATWEHRLHIFFLVFLNLNGKNKYLLSFPLVLRLQCPLGLRLKSQLISYFTWKPLGCIFQRGFRWCAKDMHLSVPKTQTQDQQHIWFHTFNEFKPAWKKNQELQWLKLIFCNDHWSISPSQALISESGMLK